MSSMTLRQAYDLASVRGFYDMPVYDRRDEKPWYYEFYDWSDWQNGKSHGFLKYDLFDTIELKTAFAKGFVDHHADRNGENKVHVANAIQQCDQFINFVTSVCYANRIALVHRGVLKLERDYTTIPISTTIELTGGVMDFIRNYKI